MGPALNPAIPHDIDPFAYGVDDFRKLVERCPRAVQLPPTVVRNDDAGAVDIDGSSGILDRHDTAETLGIGLQTVKAHLQHIFQKTGTARQAELVALTSRCAGPLNGIDVL